MHSCIQYIHISLTFKMQNVKEFLFRKEKEFLLIIFTYIFLDFFIKANKLYRFSTQKKKKKRLQLYKILFIFKYQEK